MDSEQVTATPPPPAAAAAPQAKARKQSLEEKAAIRAEDTKTFVSWTSYMLIGILLLLLQATGVAYFTRGFLLSRPVFEDHSACDTLPLGGSASGDGCWMDKGFDRAVLVIIDALRFDFVVPSDDDLLYHNSFPILYDYAKNHPQNSLLVKFMADPPTTTLQRLKGLTTGSLPTFIDAGSNFAGSQIEEDNWLNQAHSLNKTIEFMGDDTWTHLFGRQFSKSNPYDSLNVWDLHTVDNGVIEHIFPSLESKPDITIGHLLGVDHAGHRYGPNHESMRSKLEQMNSFIQRVINEIDDKTVLLVMGDHGMDPKGDHGGDTRLELESTLFMYSKKKSFGRLNPSVYDISRNGENYRSVQQIDLVPTLSLLLGLPIPFNNLGSPIAEAFIGPKSKDLSRLTAANKITAAQIRRYQMKFDGLDEGESWNAVEQATKQSDILANSQAYQSETLESFRAKWVTFDLKYMYIGICLLVSSGIVVLAFFRQANTFHAFGMFKVIAGTALAGAVLGGAASFALPIEALWSAALGLSFGVLLSSIPMIFKLIRQFTLSSISWWTILAVAMTAIHALGLSSNSFTVWEDRTLQYLLTTFGVLTFCRSVSLPSVKARTLGMWHSAIFVLLTKISSYSVLCREEQGQECLTTFYKDASSSVSHPYTLIGLGVAVLVLPFIVASFYSSSASYHGAASLWIGLGLRVVMAFAALYWVLDGVDTYSWKVTTLDHNTIKTLKLVLARTALGASLLAANYAWWLGTVCVKVDMVPDERSPSKMRAAILGFSNVYGSSYFLLILNVFGASLIVNKPMGGILLSLFLYQLLTLLEIIDIHDLQSNTFITSVVFGVLGNSYFFSTGHHASLQAIQWEIGFVPVETITLPFTHLAITLNTFAPVIMSTLASPLAVLWKIPPTKNPINLHGRVVSSILGSIFYHTVISTAAIIVAMQFRRHLMLWKIFAPRYMLAGIQLVVVDVIAVIAIAASGKCISYVRSVFG